MTDRALLTVRTAAKQLGVTPRTLKYYEELGLVSPGRNEGRYRLYGDGDLQRFSRILRLRAFGFSLHAIREMIRQPLNVSGGSDGLSKEAFREIRSSLQNQLAMLDLRTEAARRELQEARTVREELRRDLDYVEARLGGRRPDALLADRGKPGHALQKRLASVPRELAAAGPAARTARKQAGRRKA